MGFGGTTLPLYSKNQNNPVKYSRWSTKPKIPKSILDQMGFPIIESTILFNRGLLSKNDAINFITPLDDNLHDPYLLPDMEKAINRISVALKTNETIGVFGDFDTDGLSGTALLTKSLQVLGGTVIPYVPHRTDEGHGVSLKAIDHFVSKNVTLMITVDCGVTSIDEIELAHKSGIDTIVTDHHIPLDRFPNAIAIVNAHLNNSKYPFRHLTGVGIAFKVMEALYNSHKKELPEEMYVFCALGTLSDVGVLEGENRYLVHKGMEIIRNVEIIGIDSLISESGLSKKDLTTEDLSFGVIPRLNVSSRLEHANTSLQLLLSSTKSQAVQIAKYLDKLNKQRQIITENALVEAKNQVVANNHKGETNILFIGKPNWQPGILGLIAGQLCELYYRPAIAVSGRDNILRASARSISEFNMVKALSSCGGIFEQFGGHSMAAGFTIHRDNLKSFREIISSIANETLEDVPKGPELVIDAEITPNWLNQETMNFLSSLEPYGNGNLMPTFVTKNVSIVSSKKVGRKGSHLKLSISHNENIYDAIAFRQGDRINETKNNLDIAYKAKYNSWNGNKSIQLTIEDFKVTDT